MAKVGTRARETHRVVPNVGGLRAWPIDTCSNKDAGRSERKTPTPCVRTNRLNAATRQDKTRPMTQATLDHIHTETTQTT